MNVIRLTLPGPSKAEVYFDSNYANGRVITFCTIRTVGGKHPVVASGSAICSPRDPTNREFGKKLAFKRAVLDGARQVNTLKVDERETLRIWRKALWDALHPEGWKPEAIETAAEVVA
jgi:hypothetical protein